MARLSIEVAAGVLQAPSGKVLIAQRPSHKHAGGSWEFPGGKLEAGEAPEQGLRRELAEELGVEVNSVRFLLRYSHAYADRDVRLHVFLISSWSGEPAGLEGQPLRWLAVDELLDAGLLPADRPVVEALQALSRF